MARAIHIRRGWDSFEELGRLQDDVNRLFEATGLGKLFLANQARSFPLVNLTSNERESILHAEIPGVEPKDLDLTITGTTLTLKGERKIDSNVPGEKFYRRERGGGHFGRSLELPHKIDHDRVEASFKDGVLKIRLPKAPEIQPRRIEVKS